ncbi:MAG: hypothetical protein GOVbin4162_55 [Prokaryotic dsDNA virus sp.]|nr:MAG: hypothetical protein GOVbin4162_55 [Prokaryotic dsDNA virus sp.]
MQKSKLFSASWCNPCKQLKKWIEAHNIEVELVDVDLHPDQVQEFRVRGVPCLVTTEYKVITGLETIKNYLREV